MDGIGGVISLIISSIITIILSHYLYLGVGNVHLEHGILRAKGTAADETATRQRDGRVVQPSTVDESSIRGTEIGQHETTSISVILDNRVAVIHRLAL